jgi:hypothetical protein
MYTSPVALVCFNEISRNRYLKGINNFGDARAVVGIILQYIVMKECNNKVHIPLALQFPSARLV